MEWSSRVASGTFLPLFLRHPYLALGDLGVAQDPVDRVDGAAEQVGVELLKLCARDVEVEVDAFEGRVHLDGGLRRRRQRALGALTGGADAAQRAGVV